MGYVTERIWNTVARTQKSRTFVGCGFCFLWACMGGRFEIDALVVDFKNQLAVMEAFNNYHAANGRLKLDWRSA